jgi:hypothetical protein
MLDYWDEVVDTRKYIGVNPWFFSYIYAGKIMISCMSINNQKTQ